MGSGACLQSHRGLDAPHGQRCLRRKCGGAGRDPTEGSNQGDGGVGEHAVVELDGDIVVEDGAPPRVVKEQFLCGLHRHKVGARVIWRWVLTWMVTGGTL